MPRAPELTRSINPVFRDLGRAIFLARQDKSPHLCAVQFLGFSRPVIAMHDLFGDQSVLPDVSTARDDFIKLRPSGGFNLIMADPPWSFDNYSEKGEGKNAKAHYDCAPIEWINALPVSLLAAQDCLLWMYATNPMLPEGLDALLAWGFTFKTAGTWIKRTKHGKEAFGTGYIFRTSNEPILIGTIGTPKPPEAHGQPSFVTTAQTTTATRGPSIPSQLRAKRVGIL